MSFLVLFLCGIAGGVLGGMGMGGGTALIPLLTIACGVAQKTAQGVNLAAFLPMSVLALFVHAKSGLFSFKGLWEVILPALLFSALSALAAAALPGEALGRAFGMFLIILSLFEFHAFFVNFAESRGYPKKNS